MSGGNGGSGGGGGVHGDGGARGAGPQEPRNRGCRGGRTPALSPAPAAQRAEWVAPGGEAVRREAFWSGRAPHGFWL